MHKAEQPAATRLTFGAGRTFRARLPNTMLNAETVAFLYKWQTLIAGVLAIMAAGFGGLFVYGQTLQARRLHDDQTRRRLRAARALSPLAVSALSAYAKETAQALHALRPAAEGRPSLVPTVPAIPVEIIPQLEKLIEAAGYRPGEAIAAVLRKLQVQSARTSDLLAEIASGKLSGLGVNTRRDGAILDAAEVGALTARLFDFARGKTEHVRLGALDSAEMWNALFSTQTFDAEFPELFSWVNRKYPSPPETAGNVMRTAGQLLRKSGPLHALAYLWDGLRAKLGRS